MSQSSLKPPMSSKSSLERPPPPPPPQSLVLMVDPVVNQVRNMTQLLSFPTDLVGESANLISKPRIHNLMGLAQYAKAVGPYLIYSEPMGNVEPGLVLASLSLLTEAYVDDNSDDKLVISKDSNHDPKIRASKKPSTVEFKFYGFSNPAISKSRHRYEFLYLYAFSRTMPYYCVDVLPILGLWSRYESILLGWIGAQRTSFLVSKPHSVPKPENLSSFRERVVLSSMLLAFAVRAINDLAKVLGVKSVESMYASLQIVANRSLVDRDLFSDNLVIDCALAKASAKVSRESNWFSVLHAFGSLSIANENTTLLCILSASIKLFLCCNVPVVVISITTVSVSNKV